MNKTFLSHAPPSLHTAMNAIKLGTTHTTSAPSARALNDITGTTLIGNG